MSKDKINITLEQLESIEHLQRMFRLNSDLIKDLCNQEQDDVVYGFELGKIYSNLEECFMDIMTLSGDIRCNNNI